MSQPLGGCPECGASQPFEQVHAVAGAALTNPALTNPVKANPVKASPVKASPVPARQPVHAA